MTAEPGHEWAVQFFACKSPTSSYLQPQTFASSCFWMFARLQEQAGSFLSPSGPLMASFYIFLSLWTFQTLICAVGPAWYLSMIQARVPVQARQDQFPQLASIIRYFQYSQTSDPFLSHSDEPCGLTAGCSLFPTPVWSALVPITCLHYFYHGLHHMQHLFVLSNKAKEKNLVSLQ